MSLNQEEFQLDAEPVETAVEEQIEAIIEAPLTLPLDQVISQINLDSAVEAVEYAAAFLVPGGGE